MSSRGSSGYLVFTSFQRAIPADGSGHASVDVFMSLNYGQSVQLLPASPDALTLSKRRLAFWRSQSTTARPRRAHTPGSSSGHSRSTRTASVPQVQSQVSYLGLSWALPHSGVRPSSCSQTPKRVSSSSDIVHASLSSWPACRSFHTGHISSGHRAPLHSEVRMTQLVKLLCTLASMLRKRARSHGYYGHGNAKR